MLIFLIVIEIGLFGELGCCICYDFVLCYFVEFRIVVIVVFGVVVIEFKYVFNLVVKI